MINNDNVVTGEADNYYVNTHASCATIEKAGHADGGEAHHGASAKAGSKAVTKASLTASSFGKAKALAKAKAAKAAKP